MSGSLAVSEGQAGRRSATILEVVGSVGFALCFYGGTVGFVLAALATQALPGPIFDVVVRTWSRSQAFWLRVWLGVRVVQQGEPLAYPALYAIKHESFFEAIDCGRIFRRPAPFPKAELLEIPLWGRAALRYGAIPVARDEGAKALRVMIAAAKERIAEGRPLVIFPEGTRIPHGASPPLRAGLAGLYRLLRVPVVPVAVDSGQVYTGFIKRRGTITYRFGEVIPPGLPRAEFEARVHAAINALN